MLANFISTVPCPEIVTALENITVEPGENASFNCLAWSYGGVYYHWYIQNSSGEIRHYDPYKRHDDGCGSYPIIHISDFGIGIFPTEVHTFKVLNAVEQFDEGWYCCVAVNECGNTTKCGWLEVDSKLTYSRLLSTIIF